MSHLQTRLFSRIISKNREVYILKIFTLATAFACTTLITLFSINEFGYDHFHHLPASVVRILARNTSPEFSGNRLSNQVSHSAFTAMRSWSSDSLILSRVKVMDELDVGTRQHLFHSQKIHSADISITKIFSFEFIDGSVDFFKEDLHSALISSTAAVKYFGTEQATGKELKAYSLADTVVLTVAAVFSDFPQNSHEQFDVLFRFDSDVIRSLQFNPHNAGVYGRTMRGSLLDCEVALNRIAGSENLSYVLQPVTAIHFGPSVSGEDAKHGDRYSMLILICISGLILFIALTSFVNLTTLTMPHRSKELAIKKLAGISQRGLMFMFASESFALCGMSLLLGIVLILLTARLIDPILSVGLPLWSLNGNLKAFIVSAMLLVIATVSPLFMAQKFACATPTRLLSAEMITFPRFKRVITFLQLGVSIFLIVASTVISRQVTYSLLKEPGRNNDHVVYLPYPKGLTNEGLSSLRSNWKKNNPNILDVFATSQLPNMIHSKGLGSAFYLISVDPGFLDFFGLKVISGRGFRANDGESAFIVNKKGHETLGTEMGNAIGVFEDMSERFHQPERPLKVSLASFPSYNYLCLRILDVDVRQTVRYVSMFFDTGIPAKISFLDRHFEDWLQYQDQLNALSNALTMISGLLACCAIYSLCLSLARDKLKQIAIRKLFGATTTAITRLLVREFLRQLVLAILVFGPLTYIFLREWLRNFVYTTGFKWTDPVTPVAYCLLVIVILCSVQSLSLNRADLTQSLKD